AAPRRPHSGSCRPATRRSTSTAPESCLPPAAARAASQVFPQEAAEPGSLNGPGSSFSSTAEGSSPPVKLSRVSEGEQLDPKTQFRQLYDQEYLSVYRSIRAVVLDSAAAEDLTQETFVRAHRPAAR